jgi:hypothetical protein
MRLPAPRLRALGLIDCRRSWLARLVFAGSVLALAGIGLTDVAPSSLAALKAAGLNGTPPPSADAFSTMINTLTENAKWLIVTGVGFVITLVSIAHGMGSSRSGDHLFRIAAMIGVVLVGLPALLA